MLKRISAQKARQRLGELMDEVRIRGDRYLVERGNRPMVAIIPVEEYVTWEKLRTDTRHKIQQVRDRNKDVAPETLEAEIREAVEAARRA
ncbi:MAG: type II toxin-antitoxin system Phd/YefM family antitoxin [Dehalococcoidia bacterium]|nr:type II toxin-antitoxin system Phd/YefM family antitoxin [Dehalococcoidia bacterium]